jgi:hypothetical protein
MDLRLANNSQDGVMLILRIKPCLIPLKSHLFNGKPIIVLNETRIWLIETTVSTTHGGKLFG